MNAAPGREPGDRDLHVTFSGTETDLHVKSVGLDNIGSDLAVADRIALLDANVRRNIAYAIMGLFAAVNLATLCFVGVLFRVDQSDLASKLIGPPDRIVNAHVLMALLGATTVQLGSAMLIMARFVFRPSVDQSGVSGE